MNSFQGIIARLKPQYFWDVDISKIDDQLSARLIIERIFNLGNIDEINLIIEFYGRDRVVEVLMNLNYLDPKTFNFIWKFFKIPAKKFRCYTTKRLKNQHWNS
ncbi:MAG: hypothetical protein NT004_11620 [Bacteroidetes bacterium]|nr:hypothetical protein [Bacteroidota bacterium]